MDKIKTSELISKLALASEESCKCEDINFEFAFHDAIKKDMNDTITVAETVKLIRAVSDFDRFSSIRTTCKVLQELGIIENDVDVFDNTAFRSELKKAFRRQTALIGSLFFSCDSSIGKCFLNICV